MALTINHNLMAMNTARNLNTAYGGIATSTRRLSSGLRVGIAADDAAGLAIRELMRSDISSINQGVRNANDAISMIQTADGALQVIDEKLIRLKELATQAATGTYTSAQRMIIDSEYQAMALEIERIAKATDFNGIKLLQGAVTTVSYTPAYLEDMTAHYTFDGTFADAEGGASVIPYNNVTLNADSVSIVGQAGDFVLPATPAGGYLEVPQVDWSAYSDLTISINVQEDNITHVQNQVSYLTYSNLFVGIHRDNNNIQFRAGPNVLTVGFDSATDRGHPINWTMTLDSDRFAVFKDGALVAEDTTPAALGTPNPAYADEHNIGIVYWTAGAGETQPGLSEASKTTGFTINPCPMMTFKAWYPNRKPEPTRFRSIRIALRSTSVQATAAPRITTM
jgi:flagellin-like hook-associated protein FlgL